MTRQLAMTACVLLAGCGGALGGEPSDADIQEAWMAYFMGPNSKVIDKETIDLSGAGDWKQITHTEKTECTKADGQPGYSCIVRVTVCVTEDSDCPPQSLDLTQRLVKSKDGWRVIPDMMSPSKPVDSLDTLRTMSGMEHGGLAGY